MKAAALAEMDRLKAADEKMRSFKNHAFFEASSIRKVDGTFRGAFHMDAGVHPLYFRYEGKGSLDFLAFTLI